MSSRQGMIGTGIVACRLTVKTFDMPHWSAHLLSVPLVDGFD